jgi:hypothetical protein
MGNAKSRLKITSITATHKKQHTALAWQKQGRSAELNF